MKRSLKTVYSDEMLTVEDAELEFEDHDRAHVANFEDQEEFNRFIDFEFDRTVLGGTPAEFAEEIKKNTDEFMRARGYPGEHEKIFAHPASMKWERAAEGWLEGPLPGRPGWFGAIGGDWWCVHFSRKFEKPEYKHVKLFMSAIAFEIAETEDEKLLAAFALGSLREQFASRDRHLKNVRAGSRVREGGQKGAAAARNEGADDRHAEMKRMIEEESLAIDEAARRLEARGDGSFASNKKLWQRRKPKNS